MPNQNIVFYRKNFAGWHYFALLHFEIIFKQCDNFINYIKEKMITVSKLVTIRVFQQCVIITGIRMQTI